MKEFLGQAATSGWKKVTEIGNFFRLGAGSGSAWSDLIAWGERLSRVSLGTTAKVGGRTTADLAATSFKNLTDSAGNAVRITFNGTDAAHVFSRHTWEGFSVVTSNVKQSQGLLPEGQTIASVTSFGEQLLQHSDVAALVSRIAPGASDVADVVLGGITWEVRVTLQGGINGMVSFYPKAGPGVVSLGEDAMKAIIWLFKSK